MIIRLRVAPYESLQTKEKSGWVIAKVIASAYASGHLRDLFITKLQTGFHIGGLNKGELQQYM